MKNSIEKIMCAVFAVILFIANIPHAVKAVSYNDNTTILEYYNAINEGTWQSCTYISESYVSELSAAEQTEFRGIHHGIANVIKASDARIIAEIDGSDYAAYAEELTDPSYYLVAVDEEVYANDGFNFNGTNYQVVICGTSRGVRTVCDVRLPLPHTVTEYVAPWQAEVYFSSRFGTEMTRSYTHADIPRDFDFKPKTIRVKRFHRDESKNAAIETVDFKMYTYVVLCGEMCPYRGDDYTPAMLEYCKACAVAARNFGWYKYLSAGANSDFHIYDCSGASSHNHPSISPKPADQLYLPEKHGSSATGHALAPLTIAATDAIWDDVFTNDEYKIFLSICSNGKYNADYKSSGRLRHQGSKYLAEVCGMDYKEILHYYYDDVKGNDIVVGNGGNVHIYPFADVGMNENFTTGDVTMLLKYLSGMLDWEGTPRDYLRRKIADVNRDGCVNTSDVVHMLRLLAASE